MNPTCAKCDKTVYPVEKLNCLDKTWHKGCFSCTTCNMTLNMKTYKGYNKEPYCNTHYPTTKFTAVADTPESMRLKKNTQQQSEVTYRKDHEQTMQQFTAVADDPETLRIKKASKQQSDIEYQSGREQARGPQRVGAGEGLYPKPPKIQAASSHPVPQPGPDSSKTQSNKVYIALYDYAAADDDEISFNEGDRIINGEVIDDGWMTGTVEKTGATGMLPSNYVEAA